MQTTSSAATVKALPVETLKRVDGSYLPLADHRAELVRSHVHTVKVGKAVLALDLVNSQLDLAERILLVLVQVSEGDLEDATLQGVVSVLQTLGAVDEGLADLADIKGGGRLDVIPVLAGEGVDTIGLLYSEDHVQLSVPRPFPRRSL